MVLVMILLIEDAVLAMVLIEDVLVLLLMIEGYSILVATTNRTQGTSEGPDGEEF